MKYIGLWSSGLRFFFEKFVKPSTPTPTYLVHAPLSDALFIGERDVT